MGICIFIEGRFKLKEIEGKDTVLDNSKTLYSLMLIILFVSMGAISVLANYANYRKGI